MNRERANALLQWINSLCCTTVQSIRDFANPENAKILLDVLRLIDKDNRDETRFGQDSTLQDMLSFIVTSLEGIYHNLDSIISTKLIASTADDLEIGKLITLLLCGAVQGNNVPHFIEKIHKLDNKVQFHLKVIIENVLQQVESGELCSRSITSLLQEQVVFKDKQEYTNVQECVFSPSVINSPAETVFSNSPLMSLMLSPQMKSKQNQFTANKLHQKIKKLEMDLDAQRHLQCSMEEDLAEKNQEVESKNTKIRELKKELVQMRMVIDELESLRHFINDYEKAEKENNKLRQRIAELEDFKAQNSNLEERTANYLKEKDIFEKQVQEVKLIQTRCERYKQQAHQWEFQASELQAALNRREEEIGKLIKMRDEALRAATESAELWKARQIPDADADEEELMQVPPSPVNNKSPNLESRLIELEFENERIKKQMASAVDPQELQRIKDALEDTEQSKKSYEENYVEAKCKILELEDRLTQVQDQARIREEALQRKIEDSEKTLNSTNEKLEHSRKEFTRVQTELMVTRREVEAHVIAMEKQRLTTSKAMDDMAAERLACEESAEKKLNELRGELEAKEKQALESYVQMSKDYEIKIRDVTKELQSLHEQDRKKMLQKIDDAAKQKDSLQAEFSLQREELKQLIEKLEGGGKQARDMYENMLADIRKELENEIKKYKELNVAFQQASVSLEQKTNDFQKEREKLIAELAQSKEQKKKLMEDTARLNEDIERVLQNEQIVKENEKNSKKEIENLQAEGQELRTEISKLNVEITSLKEKEEKVREEKKSCESVIASLKENEAMLLEEKVQISLEVASLKKDFTSELKSITENLGQENEANLSRMKTIIENLNKKIEKANQEIEERDKSLEEFTQTCGKMKQEIDATEVKLLDVTRERNDLEKQLARESQLGQEKMETLSFQMEQLKTEHTKAVQEMMCTLQDERKNHKKEKKDVTEELEKACHGLKVAADNIEELRQTIQETEQKITHEKSKVKTLEEQLDKLKDDSKEKQKKIFEEASKKNWALEEAYTNERTNWKKKLDTATEEAVALRKEMFENSQKHSGEMMELRRLLQEKEEFYGIEEKKLREEIRGFIGNLANERVTNSELQEKLKQTEKQRDEITKKLVDSEKILNDKIDGLEASEKAKLEEIEAMKGSFESEKRMLEEEKEKQIQERLKEVEKIRLENENLNKELVQVKKDFQDEKENIEIGYQEEIEKRKNKQAEHEKMVEELNKKMKLTEEEKQKEVLQSHAKMEEIKQALELEIFDLKKKVDESSSPFEELKLSFESLREEKNNITSEYEQFKQKWNEKENELNGRVNELEQECKKLLEKEQAFVRDEEEVAMMNEHIEKLEQDNNELEERLQEERVVSRRLGSQVNSLEAQLKHADRALREQNHTIQNIQNQSDNIKKKKQMLIEVDKVIPVQNVQEFLDDSSSADDDNDLRADDLNVSSQGSTASLASNLEEFKKSTTSFDSLDSRSSLRSTSSNHGRAAANRRQSAIYLKGNTTPTRRTTATFFIVGDEFARDMEEEPLDHGYDWERLAELERRNTICPPHLKTSYPIETQTRPNVEKGKKDTLLSSLSDTGFRARKRKSHEKASASDVPENKLRRDNQTSKSESYLKRSKSKRISEKMSSKINSLRYRSSENLDKETDKKKNGGGNIAFSIDMSPSVNKNNVSLRSLRLRNKISEAKVEEGTFNGSQREENTAFTIENSPPRKSNLKPKRRRTINRSTASTQLVLTKDKEVCKTEKKKEYLKRKPLRQTNIK